MLFDIKARTHDQRYVHWEHIPAVDASHATALGEAYILEDYGGGLILSVDPSADQSPSTEGEEG